VSPYKGPSQPESAVCETMRSTGAADVITNKGSSEFNSFVAITDQLQVLGINVANMERQMQRLPEPVDTSGLQLGIKAETKPAWDACFFTVLVYIDTPGLHCLEDFSSALGRSSNERYDNMCMSISPWSDVWGSQLQLKRPIKYIDGVVAADAVHAVAVAQDLEKAWIGAVVLATTVGKLCLNSNSCDKVQGFVQKTFHFRRWADLISQAADSGYFFPNGQYLEKNVQWGYGYKEVEGRLWFAQFLIATVQEKFRLSSNGSRKKTHKSLLKMPSL